MDELIKVDRINKNFLVNGIDQPVLSDINFSVSSGKFVCIVGPSGCGKSTLLRIVTRLMKPSSGNVTVSDEVKFSMVFQNFALFPWLTVLENVSFGLEMAGVNVKTARRKAMKYIEEMGLKGVEDKHPKELSGGMKQRVGIARALAVEPNLLILDEPFSALDVFTARKLRSDLLSIWRKNNLTVLMVSHLIEEAVELADEVIVMSPNPGRIKSIEKITLPRPRKTRDQDFFDDVDRIERLIID